MLVLAGLLVLAVPVWPQVALSPEVMLNDVTLNSTFVEVLTRRGIPHFIGPSVNSSEAITQLLSTRPLPAEPVTPGAAGGLGAPGAPRQPYRGGAMPPAGTNWPATGMGTPTGEALPQPAKEKKPHMVWRYDGNGPKPDPKAGMTTYVFFNERGTVEAVVVNKTGERVAADIRTESGFGFGAKMFDIVKRYEWPEPLARVGSLYFCAYPNYNVTFAADSASRKVVCIAIGLNMQLAVLEQKTAELPLITPISPVVPAGVTHPTAGGTLPIPGMGPGVRPGMRPGMGFDLDEMGPDGRPRGMMLPGR